MAYPQYRNYTIAGLAFTKLCLSIALIVCGSLMVYWGVVDGFYYTGLWGGIVALITSICGIVGGVKHHKTLLSVFMTLSIVTAVVAGVMLYLNVKTEPQGTLEGLKRMNVKTKADIEEVAFMAMCGRLALIWLDSILLVIAILSASFSSTVVFGCCGTTEVPNRQFDVVYVPNNNPYGYPPPPNPSVQFNMPNQDQRF